jgi:hypothetical protein
LPAQDKYTFCPNNGANGTCYFWNATIAAYSTHKLACQNLGGYLVSFNTAEEQRLVQTQLSGVDNYWIGIEPFRNVSQFGPVFVWTDGQFIGNFTPSNSNPYRHWWVALDRLWTDSCMPACRLQGSLAAAGLLMALSVSGSLYGTIATCTCSRCEFHVAQVAVSLQ